MIFSNAAYLFHRKTGWESLPNMSRNRRGMMCGLVTNSQGERKIVIAGGRGERTEGVEIFDLQTMQWNKEPEPDFPFDVVSFCKNIPYGRSFLVIGGLIDHEGGVTRADTVYSVSR